LSRFSTAVIFEIFMNAITEIILQRLIQAGGFVSGEDLCREFAITRSAVWKHIRQLRMKGHRIDASTGRGYRLAELSGFPVAAEVGPYLTTERLGRNHVYRDVAVSTNLLARSLAREGSPDGTVVVADSQTGGRGRMRRNWISPPGVNLYCSVVLRPAVPSRRVPEIPLIAAAAIHQALEDEYPGLNAAIKWPNDILVKGLKVCGILCEMESEPDLAHVVVAGFGVNLNLEAIPEELLGIATSIMLETGLPGSRPKLLARILNRFEVQYDEWLGKNDLGFMLPYLEEHSWLKNKDVVVEQFSRVLSGRATGLSPDGQLLLLTETGAVVAVASGEAHLRSAREKNNTYQS
jgi:BirA family biotin operon repressor/biotin-[acetyl-CoA-carboxylase] ligase